MEKSLAITVLFFLVVSTVIWAWKFLNKFWLRPKRLEKLLRQQGLQGNPYRFLVGDTKQMVKMQKEAQSKPMNDLSDDITPRINAHLLHTLHKFGKNCFVWFGPTPRLIMMDPNQVKQVLNNVPDFPKQTWNPLVKFIGTGLANYEGHKWAKHRKIVTPAFSLEKLKMMLPSFFESCNDMIGKWDEMLGSDGSREMDVWPFLQKLSKDVISRTAYGSSYQEGRRIFELLQEQCQLTLKILPTLHIPGWWFVPTKTHRRMRKVNRDIESSIKSLIKKREEAMKAGEVSENDFLGTLLESNQKEMKEYGNNNKFGMTIKDVIEECKLFYFAGQETTSVLLVWSLVLLSRYLDWQERAREEVLQVFGNRTPDFDGLSHLKIVTMILYEVLRLYPPSIQLVRTTHKDMKLEDLLVPAGVQVYLPILQIHHDCGIWGEDANEFKPERFSEGIAKATNGQVSYIPFGWGPRICLGQNFALLEAKMALSMILQRFHLEISPSYAHAPTIALLVQPQHGAHIILSKLK
ncbi:hypothetical protein L6164_000988 [Bauhinia variegata]|uniref:Uncharacterized protein n=1 Tax=Bauhinia variegata TaxID=167791 RepID=A0ACB9Q9I8_BAUVA|nr:hypothetical protein L6164_000988 [Bauhinia variegata]